VIDTEELIGKLQILYDREVEIQEKIETLIIKLQQTKEDIELMETAIMYQSNRIGRGK